MKTERKGKAPHKEKINAHAPSGWCVASTSVCWDDLDPLKMYCSNGCAEKFVEHIRYEVRQLFEPYPQQPMIELTNELKRELKTAEKYRICF